MEQKLVYSYLQVSMNYVETKETSALYKIKRLNSRRNLIFKLADLHVGSV